MEKQEGIIRDMEHCAENLIFPSWSMDQQYGNHPRYTKNCTAPRHSGHLGKQHQLNPEFPPWTPHILTMLSLSSAQHHIGHTHCVLQPQTHSIAHGLAAATSPGCQALCSDPKNTEWTMKQHKRYLMLPWHCTVHPGHALCPKDQHHMNSGVPDPVTTIAILIGQFVDGQHRCPWVSHPLPHTPALTCALCPSLPMSWGAHNMPHTHTSHMGSVTDQYEHPLGFHTVFFIPTTHSGVHGIAHWKSPGFPMLHINLHCHCVIQGEGHAPLVSAVNFSQSICGKVARHHQRYPTPHFLFRVFKRNKTKKCSYSERDRFILRECFTSFLGLANPNFAEQAGTPETHGISNVAA